MRLHEQHLRGAGTSLPKLGEVLVAVLGADRVVDVLVLAGAELDLSLLPSLGLLGIVYVLGRAGGKLLGARVGARRAGFPEVVQRLLGFSIFAQAGLAIGLVLVTKERFPELAPTISTVVLGAVAVFELVGPLSTRLALTASRESRAQDSDPLLPIT